VPAAKEKTSQRASLEAADSSIIGQIRLCDGFTFGGPAKNGRRNVIPSMAHRSRFGFTSRTFLLPGLHAFALAPFPFRLCRRFKAKNRKRHREAFALAVDGTLITLGFDICHFVNQAAYSEDKFLPADLVHAAADPVEDRVLSGIKRFCGRPLPMGQRTSSLR
jgi:hypothetical protein